MPLPKAVQKISDEAEALAVESGAKPGIKPVETASAQLKPVVTPEPVQDKSKIDQDDYKQRYINFKKATDQTITELRQTLATTQATLTTVQGQYQALLEKPAASVTQPVETVVNNDSSVITKDSPVYKQYLDKLPKSIKDEYTEDYLFDQFVIQLSANNQASQEKPADLSALEAKVENVVEFQEKTRAQLYEEEMDRAFPNDEWITLANGEEWNAFLSQTVSAVDNRTYRQIVVQGSESHTAATVTWVLNEFKQAQKLMLEEVKNVPEVVNPLLNQVTPEGAGGGGGDPIAEINSQAETFTQSQVNRFYIDWAANDVYTQEEAISIEKSIIAADKAGKLIPG